MRASTGTGVILLDTSIEIARGHLDADRVGP